MVCATGTRSLQHMSAPEPQPERTETGHGGLPSRWRASSPRHHSCRASPEAECQVVPCQAARVLIPYKECMKPKLVRDGSIIRLL